MCNKLSKAKYTILDNKISKEDIHECMEQSFYDNMLEWLVFKKNVIFGFSNSEDEPDVRLHIIEAYKGDNTAIEVFATGSSVIKTETPIKLVTLTFIKGEYVNTKLDPYFIGTDGYSFDDYLLAYEVRLTKLIKD